MGETIGAIVVLLLALYGCATLISDIMRWMFRPNVREDGYFLFPLSGHLENVASVIRSAAAQVKVRVLIVDAGMDDSTRRNAIDACRKLRCADFYGGSDPDSIAEWVSNSLQTR